jgi:hypothetical protein
MPKRKLYADRSQKNTPDTLIGWLIALSPNSKSKVVVLRWKNFLGCLPPKKAVLTKCKVMNVIWTSLTEEELAALKEGDPIATHTGSKGAFQFNP